MKKMLSLVLLVVFWLLLWNNASAENEYPYKSVCPPNTGYNPDGETRNSSILGGPINDGWWNKSRVINGEWVNLNYWVDAWSFAQCNCTSYVAHMLRDPFNSMGDISYDPIYGVDFKNSYLGQHWGNGGRWWIAAKRAGIAVDMIPLPGDAVYFYKDDKDKVGHIARVEWVKYDDNMNWQSFKLSEYNIVKGSYGERIITRGMKKWTEQPKGFIHVLATKNPEFYFNFYDLGYDAAGQTKEEWEYIYALVMKKYYKGNDSKYTTAFNDVWNTIGGGLPSGFGGGSSNGGLPPVSGDKTDLTPDFDIYNEQGQEISTNNSNDPIQTVQVGQRIKLNLTTEVHNDDTENHLRNSNSNSIEGPIYYWIEGVVIIW